MPTFRVVLTKSFTWRGQEEEWSNGYWLTAPTAPADRTARGALIDAIWDVEKTLLLNTNMLASALYYAPGSVVSDESFVYPARGATGARAITGSAVLAPTPVTWHAEQCLMVKANAGRTAKGRPRYLVKYYHSTGGPAGESVTALQSAVNAQVTKFIDGTLPGTARWSSPAGVVATGIGLDQYARIHQLKRRGRRPTTP